MKREGADVVNGLLLRVRGLETQLKQTMVEKLLLHERLESVELEKERLLLLIWGLSRPTQGKLVVPKEYGHEERPEDMVMRQHLEDGNLVVTVARRDPKPEKAPNVEAPKETQ